jgi:hypothetical protein
MRICTCGIGIPFLLRNGAPFEVWIESFLYLHNGYSTILHFRLAERIMVNGDVGSNATLSLSICQPLLLTTPLTPGPSASTSTPCYGISPSIIMS